MSEHQDDEDDEDEEDVRRALLGEVQPQGRGLRTAPVGLGITTQDAVRVVKIT